MLSLSALLMAMLPWTSATAAIATADDPTTLVDDDDPTDYPDPICSKCKIIVIDDDDAEAFLIDFGITYVPEDPEYDGDLEVTLLEDDEDPERAWVIDVRPAEE